MNDWCLTMVKTRNSFAHITKDLENFLLGKTRFESEMEFCFGFVMQGAKFASLDQEQLLNI